MMSLHKTIVFTALAALAACGSGKQTSRQLMFEELGEQKMVATPPPRAGVTYASFDNGHGMQIEYLASNGRAFLWYPGNRRVVVGEWRVLLDEICYRYGSNTFNPQTLQRGGSWSCMYEGRFKYHTVAFSSGDPFRLSSGSVPFIRQKCDLPKPLKPVKKVTCK